MSKFLEYVKLLPSGLANAPAVLEGIVNSVKIEYGALDDDKKEEIVRRRVICEGCPFNSYNAQTSEEYKELVGKNYFTDRDDIHCAFCGCPLGTRTATLSKPCGIASWNKNNKDNQIPLKWKPYGKGNKD